jgi:ActR/RegA family two-component response regulator
MARRMARRRQRNELRRARPANERASSGGATRVSKPRGSFPSGAITVVLVAGSRGWGEAVRRYAEAAGDLRVVAEASDARTAVALVRTHRPAVVLVDRKIWRNRGPFSVAAALREAHRAARILAVARRADDAFALRVIRDGGHGVMAEEALARQVPKAIRCLAAVQAWLTRAQDARVLAALWRMKEEGRGADAGFGRGRRRYAYSGYVNGQIAPW